MLRGVLSGSGIVIAQGIGSAIKFAQGVLDGDKPGIPEVAIDVLGNHSNQLGALHLRVRWYEMRMTLQARQDPRVMLSRTIPGVGPVTASAIVAKAGDASQFENGREFAAWPGLTPLNRSSGGKEKLGPITKMGDRYVRDILLSENRFGTWFAETIRCPGSACLHVREGGPAARAPRKQAGHASASDRCKINFKYVLLCSSYLHRTFMHCAKADNATMGNVRQDARLGLTDIAVCPCFKCKFKCKAKRRIPIAALSGENNSVLLLCNKKANRIILIREE